MRYILYSFPGWHGEPRYFRTRLGAWFFAWRNRVKSGQIYELKDTKTGIYIPYWM